MRSAPRHFGPVPTLVARCRTEGLDVPVASAVALAAACEALATLDALDGGSLYWAGRATVVRSPTEVVAYDRAFSRFLLGVEFADGLATGPPDAAPVPPHLAADPPAAPAALDPLAAPAVHDPGASRDPGDAGDLDASRGPGDAGDPGASRDSGASRDLGAPGDSGDPDASRDAGDLRASRDPGDAGELDASRGPGDVSDPGDGEHGEPEAATVVRASRLETLRHADLATLDPRERAEVDALVSALRVHRPVRRSSRTRASHRRRGRLDLDRTLRASLRAGGDAVVPRTRRRVDTPRRLLVLVDVSGSMAGYARSMLRFAHAAARQGRRVEVFTVGTRLTRVTELLAVPDPDRAMTGLAREVQDWAGGTRLGDALVELDDRWSRLARGATVVILSDGWERGGAALLGDQMARLHRLAHRVVWVNPLKASEGFEPTAAGMAAALPHVDELVEGHSLAAFERLASRLDAAHVSVAR